MGIRVEGIQLPLGGPEQIAMAVTPLALAGFERHFLVSFEKPPGLAPGRRPRLRAQRNRSIPWSGLRISKPS